MKKDMEDIKRRWGCLPLPLWRGETWSPVPPEDQRGLPSEGVTHTEYFFSSLGKSIRLAVAYPDSYQGGPEGMWIDSWQEVERVPERLSQVTLGEAPSCVLDWIAEVCRDLH